QPTSSLFPYTTLFRSNDAGDFKRGLNQVRNQGIDRFNAGGPAAAGAGERGALTNFSFLADGLADTLDFSRGGVQKLDNVVERLGEITGGTGLLERQADAKIASLDGPQGPQKLPVDNTIGQLCIGHGLLSGKGLARLRVEWNPADLLKPILAKRSAARHRVARSFPAGEVFGRTSLFTPSAMLGRLSKGGYERLS